MPIDLTLAYSRGEASYTGGTKGEFHVCRIERVFSNKFLKTGCLLLGVIALSQPVLATEFEMSRLATELNAASSQLAKQLRGGGYHSVRFSAQRLTRASADLLNAIRRNRSPSFLRSEFRDVARHYQEMEQAFLRLSREHDRNVYHAVGTVCNLFTGLNSEFYHARYAQPAPDVYIATPPVVTRYRLPPYHTDRSRNGRYGQDHLANLPSQIGVLREQSGRHSSPVIHGKPCEMYFSRQRFALKHAELIAVAESGLLLTLRSLASLTDFAVRRSLL